MLEMEGGCLWLQSEGGAHALDHTSGSGTMLSFRRTYRMPWLLGQTAIARS